MWNFNDQVSAGLEATSYCNVPAMMIGALE